MCPVCIQIADFHKKKDEIRRVQEEEDQQRMEELKKVLEQQAVHDRER